jgi:hypothetical protein
MNKENEVKVQVECHIIGKISGTFSQDLKL